MESIGLLSLLLLFFPISLLLSRCCDVCASHFPPVRQSWQNGRPFIVLVAPILVKNFVVQFFFSRVVTVSKI
jgi:hypothetical protein